MTHDQTHGLRTVAFLSEVRLFEYGEHSPCQFLSPLPQVNCRDADVRVHWVDYRYHHSWTVAFSTRYIGLVTR